MKKGFVALLIALALVVIVSPGIVGRLAERSMDENLDWAATESEDVVVTSQGFDRGWFSSAGRHRVEFHDGELRDILLAYSDSNDVPALIIDTRLDHGLIPLSSMIREKGSLAPGLGSAISTLSIESARGETIPLPGKIYSKVSLTGELNSNYVLEAGSFEHSEATASWGDVDVLVTTDPSSGDIGFRGIIESFAVDSVADTVRIGKISFSGEQRPTPFGFRVGPLQASIESVSFDAVGLTTVGPIAVDAQSSISGDRVSARSTLTIGHMPLADLGAGSIELHARLLNGDGHAIGNLKRQLDAIGSATNPNSLRHALEIDAQRLLAAGLEFHIDEAVITVPQGSITSEVHVVIDDTDVDTFVWTSLLLAADASVEFSIPAELVDLAIAMDPQASTAVGMGFLRKRGDAYEMVAKFEDGLLTVNGAPMPIPWP